MGIVDCGFWNNKNVLVTGHSGFMGSWLSETLLFLGARVTGLSLNKNDNLSPKMDQIIQDTRDEAAICSYLNEIKPEIIFHLAGISNIPYALDDPVGAFTINVGGTVNLLNAVRNTAGVCAIVVVTSDKCYKNTGHIQWKQENDELGGSDPYSASKAACEIAVQSFSESFLQNMEVSTVRVCNLIGGGDMTPGRLLPTLALSANSNEPIALRNPNGIRPWLYVLDAIKGYLSLANAMCLEKHKYSGAWNLGPNKSEIKTVEKMARTFIGAWGNGAYQTIESEAKVKEDDILLLNTEKANSILKWYPTLSFEDMMIRTVNFYKRQLSGEPLYKIYGEHIRTYFERE